MTIRTFSSFKFGEETFGASDGDTLAWGIEIDWENKGYFDGSNETGRMIGISGFRGKREFLKPRGQGFEPVKTGSYIITLDNSDGRYNPYNQDSPLYPNVSYGVYAKISVRDISADVIYPVFVGIISDIKLSGYGTGAKARVYIKGLAVRLRENVARVPLSQDLEPSAAIGKVLDAIDYPSRFGTNLTANADNIKYFWASGNKSAQSTINDITSSFMGYFFIGNDGKATYVPRTSIVDSGIEFNQNDLLKDIGLPSSFENNKNVVRIKAHPRTIAGTGIIWQLIGDTPAVQVGNVNSETIWANYTYNDVPCPADNVAQPVAATDFLINSQSDGGGTDLTASCTVTLTDFGDTAKLVVTNNSSQVGYIIKLQIKGDAIYEQNNADIVYPADSMPDDPRELFLDLIWQQDLNVAKDFSDLLGAFFSNQTAFIEIQIDNRPQLQYSNDLFDIVTVNIAYLGLTGISFRVAGIEHKSKTENCQSVLTTLYLEPYISFENYWLFPIANFGIDTVFGA